MIKFLKKNQKKTIVETMTIQQIIQQKVAQTIHLLILVLPVDVIKQAHMNGQESLDKKNGIVQIIIIR